MPDGDPEVLLTGFGMEDAHAVANSLQWGPDGWLYGAPGQHRHRPRSAASSFSRGSGAIIPITKQFELFAEGGGNTWGLDFDAHGNVIAGTNWGGFAMLHQVQGGYYIKGFGKHGPLHNPHAYGYFDHVPYHRISRAATSPAAASSTRAAPCRRSTRTPTSPGTCCPTRSTGTHSTARDRRFTCKHGGDFLMANDTWFRPIDCLTGPDGAVYVADWYDKRANHVDPVDNWDSSNGRIYKIQAKGAKPSRCIDPPLGKRSSKELVALLDDPNSWLVGEARRSPDGAARRLGRSRPAQDGAGKQGQTALWNRCGRCTSAAASMRTSRPSCSTTPTRTCGTGRSA